MPLATTREGSLHFEIVDRVAPSRAPREAVLFHHGIGASAGIWAGWFPALADAHRLVSFDMRGYGRSHIPAADFAWSLEQMVDDLFAVADAAELQRFHLVGESIGGTVALAAALARPQAWSDAFLRDRFHDYALSADQRTWFAAQQEKWPRESILNALRVLIGTDLSARLKDIAQPTLLLHPDGSPFIPVPVMAELHRLLPDAELNVIGHSRHGLPYSHATVCASLLRAFLDRKG